MEESTDLGTSKEKPIEINEEDESSDEENSVIILDSDTEPEDRGGNDDDNEEDDDSGEDEEDSEESETEEEDSDSSTDSESDNSVWSDVGEAANDEITAEAAEARIIEKFEKAMISIADNDVERGQQTLQKLLEDPIIACFTQEAPDYDVLEEPPRLAKMLQLFIAIHKNLAKLCEKSVENPENKLEDEEKAQQKHDEIQHLCQVLAYEPNNAEVWLDVAIKSVEFGDLNFAKYSFKRCESLKESLESHATLLYLTCDYSESLTVLKQFHDQNDTGLNDKMKYLKYKIRTTNQYYKLLCDRIFDEDEVYTDIEVVEKRKILAFDERIEALRKRVEERKQSIEENFESRIEGEEEIIQIQISAEQDLRTVCTIFCDLFDRIHAYSHCRHQLIEVTEWESRRDYLEVVETIEKLVDIVECVEELTEKAEEDQKKKRGKRQKKQEKKEYLANWRRRLFLVEKCTNSDEVAESEPNTTADEDESQGEDDGEDKRKNGGMPQNELAIEFHLNYSDVKSIICEDRKREKTPPPSLPEFIDCDYILKLLESKFSGQTHNILEILEITLFLITEHSPSNGAIPESMREVTKEMFNRVALFSEIHKRKYHKMNVLLMELNARNATETMVLKYISPFHTCRKEDETSDEVEENPIENREFVLRFMWQYVQTGLKDETKLEYLHTLRSLLQPYESIPISSGSFATWDVDISIDDLEKKKRIESVKHLWKSKNYQNLVDILQSDIDFSSIGIEEAIEMLSYWLQSLEKLKSHVDLMDLMNRMMHFYLFSLENSKIPAEKIERNLEFILHKLHKFSGKEFCKISNTSTLSTVGYFICHIFKKYPRFEKDWKNWRILYEIVKIQRGNGKEYIEQLNKLEDPSSMPLLELDLLVKAHEVLGEYHCCAQKNYEFLFFVIDRFHDLIDNIPILEMCYLKDNGYLWNNLNVEMSQLLFCLFGKYSRKIRARENHENGGKCTATLENSRKLLQVILVQPLPLYDEKEKLMHDVIDLLNSKLSFLLEFSTEKKEKIKEFKNFLQQSVTIEDVNLNLKKCQDDVNDYTQSIVWYSMALSSFRQNSFKEAAKYSELYLLTEESLTDDRLRSSSWAMLAHASAHDLFQLELHEIYEQWKWRIMPSRLAIATQKLEPVPHFDLAVRMYQLASSLARFHRTLPKTDPRRQDISDIAKLRVEARDHFDKSLELTHLGEDGEQPEHQWLCYFFIGKLEAKSARWDILKVVESFYEAACGCELTGFYYPLKVATKKQSNFEPLEVHYQAFSAVYKYLVNNEMPDLNILRKLKVMLKLLNDGHKVVKPNGSLFKVNHDVYSVMEELVMETVLQDHRIENRTEIPPNVASDLCLELCSDLKEMCIQAFTLVTDKFPHTKSYYRLAQLYLEKGDIDKSSDQIFKHAFKRKKRDDGMFDNCVEISCNDINRNGSYSFHIERCIKLGAQIVQKTVDLHNVVAMLTAMINIISKDDEEHVEKPSWKQVVSLYLTAMEHIVMTRENVSARSTPSPGPDGPPKTSKPHHLTLRTLRSELWRLWQTVNKCSKGSEEMIRLIKAKTEVLIVHCFQSIEELKKRMQPVDGNIKKKNVLLKRKFDAVDVAKNLQEQLANKNMEGLVKRMSQSAATSGTNTPAFNEMVRQFIQSSQNMQNSPNAKAYSDVARVLAAQQAAAVSKNSTATASSVASTSTAATAPVSVSVPVPKPIITPKSVVAPKLVVAPKPAASALTPVVTLSPSTSTQPIRPTPRYSPISSDDDDIQCINPPPAKKPAPTPSTTIPVKPDVPKPSTSMSAPVATKPTALPPQKPVCQNQFKSILGLVSTAQQATPPKPTLSVTGPSTSTVSAPKLTLGPSSSVQHNINENVAGTSKPVQKPTPIPSKSSTELTSQGAQIAAILANKSQEQLMQIVLENSNTADPLKKALAAQAYQVLSQKHLAQQQTNQVQANLAKAAKQAASKAKTVQPSSAAAPTYQAAQYIQAIQQIALAQQTQQAQQRAQQAKLAKEKADRDAKAAALAMKVAQEKAQQDAKAAQLIRLAQEKARSDARLAEQVKKAKELAERQIMEKAAKDAKLAREKADNAILEKAARDAHAAQLAKKAKEQANQATWNSTIAQMTPTQMAQMAQVFSAMAGGLGPQMNIPTTSGTAKSATAQPKPVQRQSQQIAALKSITAGVPGISRSPITATSSQSRPQVNQPLPQMQQHVATANSLQQQTRTQPHQIARPQPQRPNQVQSTSSTPTIRQSTSSSSLQNPPTIRPVASQQHDQSAGRPQNQTLDHEAINNFLRNFPPEERPGVVKKFYNFPK